MPSLSEILQLFLGYLQAGGSAFQAFWVYILIILGVAIEGPTVILLASTAASTGFIHPLPVFISAVVGNLAADSLWFLLGYVGRLEWLMKAGRRIGVNQAILDSFVTRLHLQAPKIMFIAKLSNSFVIPALIAAGVAKIPWRRWFPLFALGEMIITGSLVVVGFYASTRLLQLESGLGYLAIAGSIVVIILVFIFVQRTLRRSKAFQTVLVEESTWGDK